jgi:uncharacterized Zn finger protein/DNA-binding XRE family transcriptional regulator
MGGEDKMGRRGYDGWPRYVSAAEKRQKAQKKITKLLKSGAILDPVEIEGRTIARTFWGKGWCKHLESFSDYSNRLPRGRSYVSSGLVCHLAIEECHISAIVSGSRLYNVEIKITKLPEDKWAKLKKQCAGKIGTLLELLQGKLSNQLMAEVTDRQNGIFPLPGEIDLNCSCPDWADMCKHVAATLYGVGRRLDEKPELLFLLRGVDQDELITEGTKEAINAEMAGGKGKKSKRRRVSADQFEDLFGIELSETESVPEDGSSEINGVRSSAGETSTVNHPSPEFAEGMITGKTVATLRETLGLSQKEFASLLKVSAVTVNNWEKKKSSLKLHEKNKKAFINVATRARNDGVALPE